MGSHDDPVDSVLLGVVDDFPGGPPERADHRYLHTVTGAGSSSLPEDAIGGFLAGTALLLDRIAQKPLSEASVRLVRVDHEQDDGLRVGELPQGVVQCGGGRGRPVARDEDSSGRTRTTGTDR